MLRTLQAYRWPANARELRDLLERATIVAGRVLILSQHLPCPPFEGWSVEAITQLRIRDVGTFRAGRRLAEWKDAYISFTLDRPGANRGTSAKALGIGPKALCSRLARIDERARAEMACFAGTY